MSVTNHSPTCLWAFIPHLRMRSLDWTRSGMENSRDMNIKRGTFTTYPGSWWIWPVRLCWAWVKLQNRSKHRALSSCH